MSKSKKFIDLELPPLETTKNLITKSNIKTINQVLCKNKIKAEKELIKEKRIIFLKLTDQNGNTYIICNKQYKTILNNEEYPLVLKTKSELDKIGNLNYQDLSWIKHPQLNSKEQSPEMITKSWTNCINLKKEITSGDTIIEQGLRTPQLGALYSIAKEWLEPKPEPSIIVMPTGTGKTETMILSTLFHCNKKVLVLVPSKILREQIADKFITLGKLRELNIIDSEALNPTVTILKSGFKETKDIDIVVDHSNIVVSTVSCLGRLDTDLQKHIAQKFDTLILDEAHHAQATTWNNVKQHFEKLQKKILLFTATPYRNDKKLINGKIIYTYSLALAQEEGYFKQIETIPIREFDLENEDSAIAEEAVKQLEKDLKEGFKHVLMARASTVRHAQEIYKIYQNIAKKHRPEIIYNAPSIKSKTILENVKSLKSKIIICVDMLGEGFDFPNLKIAALHDTHKNLTTTIQFIGRFTRRGDSSLGNAKIIFNIANQKVGKDLKNLYSTSSDWNIVLQESGERKIEQQIQFNDLISGFDEFPTNLPLRSLKPKLSAVVYKVDSSKWYPLGYKNLIRDTEHSIHDINEKKKLLVFIKKSHPQLDWMSSKDFHNDIFELYIAHLDVKNHLLFINSTNNNGLHYLLAKAICPSAEIVKGDIVYRAFHGILRLNLFNVGLKESFKKNISHVSLMGSKVHEGISSTDSSGKIKSNVFGVGFERGYKTSIGCSYKGRIWSRKVGNLYELLEWFKNTSVKISNNHADADLVKGTLKAKTIYNIPKKIPITLSWSDVIYDSSKKLPNLHFRTKEISFYDTNLELVAYDSDDNIIKFFITYKDFKSLYTMSIDKESGYTIESSENNEFKIKRSESFLTFEDWLNENPPIIRFEDNSYLEGNYFVDNPANFKISPFNTEKIISWDWKKRGVDITSESMGINEKRNTIQYEILQHLKSKNAYSIIFDDDGPYEIADLIGLRLNREGGLPILVIDFYHCKYSSKEYPGFRQADLYEVCGQAQVSVEWKNSLKKFFSRIYEREKKAQENQSSRLKLGDIKTLQILESESVDALIDINISIVQPGVSLQKISKDQLRLLGATELYLNQTAEAKFQVYINE